MQSYCSLLECSLFMHVRETLSLYQTLGQNFHLSLQAIKMTNTNEWFVFGLSFIWFIVNILTGTMMSDNINFSLRPLWLYACSDLDDSKTIHRSYIPCCCVCGLKIKLPSCLYKATHFTNWHIFLTDLFLSIEGRSSSHLTKPSFKLPLSLYSRAFWLLHLWDVLSDNLNGKIHFSLYFFLSQVRRINSMMLFFCLKASGGSVWTCLISLILFIWALPGATLK